MRFLKHLVNVSSIIALALLLVGLAGFSPAEAKDCSVNDVLENGECDEELAQEEVEEAEAEAEALMEPPWLSFVKMIVALVVVIALLYGLLRFVNKRAKTFQETKALHLVSGVSLGQNKSVQLVKVGETLLVVGVGDQVQLLKEIADPDEITAILAKQQAGDEEPFLGHAFGSMKAAFSKKTGTAPPTFQHILKDKLAASKQELQDTRQAFIEKRKDR
ncbi:flagellar biosynthetic protein FliO [Shouchella tritolerans]|uniref:flagellar biosynthetic protein FliO n=1 Tax=Shouchella tritolerans TaxID=2979466 RepID=UPI0021E78AE5|nr:flagellar biosynthetic protein FliO [Shouchella tritolerans]